MRRFFRYQLLFTVLALFTVAPARPQVQGGVDILLAKARSLEARGRMDLAADNWRKILLVNPNQTEALAGLARNAKETGQTAEERAYLDRLRKINPHDPEIAAVDKLRVFTPEERDKLDEAGRLAMQHKPDDAMKIYREVLGDQQPPPGKWAEPFYETEAASTGGRTKAIAQLRAFCAQNANQQLYRLWLASVLSLDQATRPEGLRLFESITEPGAAEQARAPWRQALLWEKDNPDVLDPMEAYLQRYPDPELQPIADALRAEQQKNVASADEQRGYQALKHKDTAAAAIEFNGVLRQSPNDVNAIAGLGFVRLDQRQFAAALSLFEKARTLAPQRQDVRDGYSSASFSLAMERGATAQKQKQSEAAIQAFQEALALRPMDVGAQLGIANALVQEHKFADAEAKFQQVLTEAPSNSDALAGMGFVRLNQGKFGEAEKLFAQARSLDPTRKDIGEGYRNAQFWGIMNLAADALNRGQEKEAVAQYQKALVLNSNDKDALAGLANAYQHSGDFTGAARTYFQLTASFPNDDSNWLELIQAQLGEKAPEAAISTSERIPALVKQRLVAGPEYPAQMALVFYAAHMTPEGDQQLSRALQMAAKSDTQPALDLRLQIAAAFMSKGNAGRAAEIYKQATQLHPDNPSGWEGLVGTYTHMGDFPEAIAAVRSMPRQSYDGAQKDAGFLNSVAVLYSSQGECVEAEDFLNRSLSLDRTQGRQPPENTQLQLADLWMREGNYGNAWESYQDIVASNAYSTDAWRGLLVVLHKQRNDRQLVAEIPRIPPAVRTQLETNPDFLVLEASAETTVNRPQNAIPLLDAARSRYTAEHKNPPGDLDIQLAWTMLAVSPDEPGLSDLLRNARMRPDFTSRQQQAIEELWSTWSLRRAEHAFATNPESAFAILIDAGSAYPRDRNIHAALASLYLKRHDKENALEVFHTWGMTGAEAGDYRMAAGAAMSAHKDTLAGQYLRRGLESFPNDPELIHMNARQDILGGDYAEGERELESALVAMRDQGASKSGSNAVRLQNSRENGSDSFAGAGSAITLHDRTSQALNDASSELSASAQQSDPPCRPERAGGDTGSPRLKPISLVITLSSGQQSSADQQQTAGQGTSTPAQPQAQPPTQAQEQNQAQQEQVQDELDAVQDRNTPVINAGDEGTGRIGDPGFDQLIINDSLLGSAFTAQNQVRFGIEAHGVNAFSGTPDGSSTLMYGTLPVGAKFGERDEAGYAGTADLSTNTFGLSVGTTPQGFPVHNVTAGIRYRPLDSWISLQGVRDSVKDSLLSYAGARDPNTGVRWGGVVSNTGTVRFDSAPSNNLHYKIIGEYASASYSYIQGQNVPDNWSASGNAGLYWNMVQGLTLGAGVTGIHYDKNLNYFSFGQGGYFSPQKYYLAAIPITWYGRHPRFEYQIKFSGGIQYLEQDQSPFYPISPPATAIVTPGFYASSTTTAANYNADLRLGYRVTPHVYFETFATANNAQNFYTQSAGFSLKFMIDPIPTSTDLPVNSIPDWTGKQPFSVR